MCHKATARGMQQQIFSSENEQSSTYLESKSYYKSLNRDEEAQLMFTHSFDIRFISKKNKIITIHNAGQVMRFHELCFHQTRRNNHLITIQITKPWGS